MTEFSSELQTNLLREIERKILLANHVVWGHGALTKEQADNILQKGITGNIAYGLTEMAIPLSSSEKTDEENSNAILGQVNHWPHKDAKYVVLIEIPFGLYRSQITEIFFDTEHGRERSRIPNRFIKGYIDVLNNKLVENLAFQPNAQPTLSTKPDLNTHFRGEDDDLPPPIPTVSDTGEDIW
jgi:hypothetical protein